MERRMVERFEVGRKAMQGLLNVEEATSTSSSGLKDEDVEPKLSSSGMKKRSDTGMEKESDRLVVTF